jgi:hypothetical protein
MPFLISAAALVFTYLVLMQLLFEDYDEFSRELRSTIQYFPISVVLDYSFGNDRIRAWIWMISGPVIGVIVYSFMSR